MRLSSAKRLRNGDEVLVKGHQAAATVLSWKSLRLEDGTELVELEVSDPLDGVVTVTHLEVK